MDIPKYLFLHFYISISNPIFPLVAVEGIDSYPFILDFRAFASLRFSAGDVLTCIINSRFVTKLIGAEHSMLALNSSHVAHVTSVSTHKEERSTGRLQTDNFVDAARTKGYSRCRVATSHYDRVMLELGVSPKEDEVAVADAAATASTPRTVYYDLMGCNCQHWVTEWKYGKAWSVQSHQPPDARCDLKDHFTRTGSASATTYNRNGQRSAVANAAWSDIKVGKGALNAQVKGPSVGAAAELGPLNTGVGLDAGLVELGGNVGKFGGVTLGLKADTKFGIGSDGASLMVLGTGWSLSRSRGAKWCILGSCLHLG